MKRFRLLLANAGLLAALAVPLVTAGTASAAQVTPLQCSSSQEVIVGDAIVRCDLALDKQVSVNGGAYHDADTEPDAIPVTVGDTVTWKITVTNNSTGGLTPHGALYVKDILPTGVSYQSYVASDGTYAPDDGSFLANKWYLPLMSVVDDSFVTNLPATLTITTKVTGTGSIENTAKLNNYDPGFCDGGGCPYHDGDNSNDQNDAWITSTAPQVLAASTTSTAPDTGFGSPSKSFAPMLIEIGLFGLAVSLLARKNSKQQN